MSQRVVERFMGRTGVGQAGGAAEARSRQAQQARDGGVGRSHRPSGGGCVDLEPPGPNVDRSAFAGFRFPPEVITVAVRWYLRYGLSHRDIEELLAERSIEVDHVTVYRWAQRFTPLFADAAGPLRHAAR